MRRLDSHFRGNDGKTDLKTFYEIVIFRLGIFPSEMPLGIPVKYSNKNLGDYGDFIFWRYSWKGLCSRESRRQKTTSFKLAALDKNSLTISKDIRAQASSGTP
jgi:hypothetical protein